jgi:protein-tyrosine phosphatase
LVADGITTVVATPHQLGRYDGQNDGATVRKGVRELQSRLDAEGIALRVLPGGDIRLDERLARLVDEDRVTTIADNRKCLLVELPHEVYLDPARVLQRLCEAGLVPVLTHPERHRYLQQRPDTVADWVEQGAVLQITAGSLTGEFGRGAQTASRYWISKGWVGVVASDAHDAEVRPPRMSAASDAIAMEFGPAMARDLCVVNPARLVAGENVVLNGTAMGLSQSEGQIGMLQGGRESSHLQRSPAAALG